MPVPAYAPLPTCLGAVDHLARSLVGAAIHAEGLASGHTAAALDDLIAAVRDAMCELLEAGERDAEDAMAVREMELDAEAENRRNGRPAAWHGECAA